MHKAESLELLICLPLATFVLNGTGTFHFLNPSAELLFGFRSHELVGAPLQKLIPDFTLFEDYLANLDDLKNDLVELNLQVEVCKKDGTIFPAQLAVRHHPTQRKLMIFVNDLTEEKNLSEKFARIFYKSPVAKILSEEDTGIIVDVNETYCRLTEYAKEELIGKSSIDLKFFTHMVEREKLIEILNAHGRIKNFELATRAKSDRQIYLLLSVERLEIHNKNFLLSTCIDITEKKKIEENLFRQAEKLKGLNEAGTRLYRANNLDEGCNEMLSYCTMLFNTKRGSIQLFDQEHRTLKMICSIGLSDKFREYFSEVTDYSKSVYWSAFSLRKQVAVTDIETEEYFPSVRHLVHKEGIHAVLSTPLFGSDGESIGIISIYSGDSKPFDPMLLGMMDLYARKAESFIEIHRINETLKELNQDLEIKVKERTAELTQLLEQEKELSDLKSRFVSMASHEFRTPLTTILSSVSLLETYSKENQNPSQKKHFEKMKSSVKNLVYILDEFLSLDKLEQNKVIVDKERFNLKQFAENISEEMTGVLKAGQNISFTYTGSLEVVLDKRILRNIILNFLSNASKYSNNDSQIDLMITVNEQIGVTIKDQGIGIPVDDQKQLFGKFFRAKNAANIQGTGLGLNIVKRYVELLDGNIDFSSTLGKGTSFTIKLPNNN